MEWLLDTADVSRIVRALDLYPLSGVTTNPSILKKEGKIDCFGHLKTLHDLMKGRPLHVQLGHETAGDMLREADEIFERIGGDVILKVPAHEEGIRAMKALSARGARVTATAVCDALQGMMAMDAGADWLAPYCNRMCRYMIPFEEVVGDLRKVIDRDGYKTKILAASFRDVSQVRRAILAGAHAVTLAPDLMDGIFSLPLLRDAAAGFKADWQAVTGISL